MANIINNENTAFLIVHNLNGTVGSFKLESVMSSGAQNLLAEQACHNIYNCVQSLVTNHNNTLNTLAQQVDSISRTLTIADDQIKANNS